jgi:hypothetical protein
MNLLCVEILDFNPRPKRLGANVPILAMYCGKEIRKQRNTQSLNTNLLFTAKYAYLNILMPYIEETLITGC